MIGSSFAAPILTAAAGADPAPGSIEICKVLTPAAGVTVNLTPAFTYSISGVTGTFTVNAGSCSAPIPASTGSHVITETLAPWFKVTSITQLPGQSYLTTPTAATLAAGTATVNVTDGNVAAVTYTNQVVIGFVEICKFAVATSGLTGTFTFGVTGADGFSSSTTAQVGACSNPPMAVPAGTVNITEGGTNLYVTAITASFNGTGNALVGTPNLIAGTSTVTVAASSDASNQTDVNYTNNVVVLKVCKVFDGTAPAGTTYPFTVTPSSTALAGPVPAPYTVTLNPGTAAAPVCSNPVAYRPGTTVTITEGIVPGTKVESIVSSGAESDVPGALSITGRTNTIIVGTPTSATSGPNNEAVETFTNTLAAPGQLKLCKLAGVSTPAFTGTSETFTVSGVTGTTTVPTGGCTVVGGGAIFPFNSTVKITEQNLSSANSVSAVTVIPSFVTEIVAGVPTLTTEPVVAVAPVLGSGATSGTVSVVTGEGTTTEVTFTDVDPPVTVDPNGPVTITNPGGANSGTRTAVNTGIAQAVAGTVVATIGSSSSIGSTSGGNTVGTLGTGSTASSSIILSTTPGKTLTAAQRKAALKLDNKSLANVKAAITKWNKILHNTKGSAHKAAERRLNALKAEQKILNLEIKLLK